MSTTNSDIPTSSNKQDECVNKVVPCHTNAESSVLAATQVNNISPASFTKRLFLFLLLLASAQFALSYTQRGKIIPAEVELARNIGRTGTDVLYFCDSVNRTTILQETNKLAISEMLQKLMPQYVIKDISHDGYHPFIYLEFCRFLMKQEKKPRLVIVHVNMASFGWAKQEQFKFQKECLFLKYDTPLLIMLYKPLTIFKAIAPIRSWNEITVANRQEQQSLATADDAMEFGRKSISDLFLVPLTHEHPQIRALLDIGCLLRDNGIRVLFYITPSNYEQGSFYVGDSFLPRLTANIFQVRSALESENFRVLDLSFSLGIEYFLKDGTIQHSHLYAKGKQFVAQQLSRAVTQGFSPPAWH